MRSGACSTDSVPSSSAPFSTAAGPPYAASSPRSTMVSTPSMRGRASMVTVQAHSVSISAGMPLPAPPDGGAPASHDSAPSITNTSHSGADR